MSEDSAQKEKTVLEPVWTKDFVLLLISKISLTSTFVMLTVTLASYAIETYKTTPSMAGIVVGAFVIGSIFSRFITGKYTEIIGRRRLLLGSTAVNCLVFLLYFVPMPIEGVIVVRLLHGAMFGLLSNASNTIAASLIPKSRMGEGLGYWGLTIAFTTALGPILGFNIAAAYGYTAMFIAVEIMNIIGLVGSIFVKIKEVDLTEEERTRALSGFKISDFFEVPALPVAFVALFNIFVVITVNTFVDDYSATLGLVGSGTFYFAGYSTGMVAGRFLFGKAIDRKGPNAVAYPSYAFLLIGLLATAFCREAWLFLFIGICQGTCYGNLNAVTQSVVVKQASPARMGAVMSTYYVLVDTGSGTAPMVMGAIAGLVGYSNMFIIDVIIAAAIAGLYFLIIGRKKLK